MIKCKVFYYLITEELNLLLFQREAEFPTVPFIDSTICFKYEAIRVERVQFVDGGEPCLFSEFSRIDEEDKSTRIETLVDNGWHFESEVRLDESHPYVEAQNKK